MAYGLADEPDDGPTAAQLLSAVEDTTGETGLSTPDALVGAAEDPRSSETPLEASEPPAPVDGDGVWLAEAAPECGAAASAPSLQFAPAADLPDIDPTQILRDRPDVYAGFYTAFYGPLNDRHSDAWLDRVGGYSPEDYARYWYDTYGRYEGYTQTRGPQGAPAEDAGDAPVGRTTIDGVPIAKILEDRPDVFRAFFTEYYGPNNDRHSDAWVQRVGGTAVEDYANYWYNAHGRVEGYVPSGSRPSPDTSGEPVGAPEPEPQPPLAVEDPSLDPWNHPAIYPDWQPPYPGWTPPTGAPAPAAAETVVGPTTLFDDTAF